MSRIASFRKTLLGTGILAILPCVLRAQELSRKEASSAGPLPCVSVLHVHSESMLRADFPRRKSSGRVEKGGVLEGRLSPPLYAGEHLSAPAETTITVTVGWIEEIGEAMG